MYSARQIEGFLVRIIVMIAVSGEDLWSMQSASFVSFTLKAVKGFVLTLTCMWAYVSFRFRRTDLIPK
jgi:hypothetical protein